MRRTENSRPLDSTGVVPIGNSHRGLARYLGFLLAASGACSAHSAAVISYSFVPLGSVADTFSPFSVSLATAINDSGHVVGYSNSCIGVVDQPCLPSLATVWGPDSQAPDAFQQQTFGNLGSGSTGYATSINNIGMVVGRSDTSSVKYSPNPHATTWSGINPVDLGVLPGGSASAAISVNNTGQVVGYSGSQFTGSQAVQWSGGNTVLLPALGGTSSAAFGINDAGDVVGQSAIPGEYLHATEWIGGVPKDLGTFFGGASSAASAINAVGTIVGQGTTADGETHAAVWTGTTMTDLGTSLGPYSVALAVNDVGQIAGRAGTGAVLWDNGVTVDLNALLASSLSAGGWTLVDAAGINDSGWIVGTASSRLTSQTIAYVLIPTAVPEPTTTALMLTGIMCLCVYRSANAGRKFVVILDAKPRRRAPP